MISQSRKDAASGDSVRQISGSMNVCGAALVLVIAIITASCSDKSPPDQEPASSPTPTDAAHNSPAEAAVRRDPPPRPREGKIGQDVVAFVRSTKIVPAAGANADCPGCPVGGTEVLTHRDMRTDKVSCSADTCTVMVTTRAVFNPGSGEGMAGGLTAWIPPEQRSAYLSGQTPEGEQTFRLRITYKRSGEAWRAVDFEPAAE